MLLGLSRVPPHERSGEERVGSLRTSAWEASVFMDLVRIAGWKT